MIRHQQGVAHLLLILLLVLLVGGFLMIRGSNISNLFPKTQISEPRVNLEEGRKLPPAQVKITKNGFVPQTVEIRAGQSVTWTNEDSVSRQLSSDGSLSETEPIEVKEEMTYPFTTPGTIQYMDKANPNLKGVVIVK